MPLLLVSLNIICMKMFLQGNMRSRKMLEDAMQQCGHCSNQTVLNCKGEQGLIPYLQNLKWLVMVKQTKRKRQKQCFIYIGDELANLAKLLGEGDDVTYLDFQTAMLKRDREWRMYASCANDQALADVTISRIAPPRNLLATQWYDSTSTDSWWYICSIF